jgi:hypothetical protein
VDDPYTSLCYPDSDLINPLSDVICSVSVSEYSHEEMAIGLKYAPEAREFFRRSSYEKTEAWNLVLRRLQ